MKNSILKILFIAFTFFSIDFVSAQCDEKKLKKECYEKLDNFIFIKSFNITEGETTFSYVFSKGTTYLITSCFQDTENKMVVELYDRNKKLIATNYYKKKDQFFPKIGYQCTATGVYYLKYYFRDQNNTCGTSVIGFKK